MQAARMPADSKLSSEGAAWVTGAAVLRGHCASEVGNWEAQYRGQALSRGHLLTPLPCDWLQRRIGILRSLACTN